ncbi:MAG TPA: calcium-binding protein [Rhizomicrobium sp.]|jgi:Ca2+-binding RTX toxin-like protein
MTTFKGTTGNDTLTGTADADTFNLIQGGEDTASGLAGNDIFTMNASFDAGDKIDGGAGSDQLWLRGDYSTGITFNDTTLLNVERIALGAGTNYKLTSSDATVASGATMTVDGSKLAAANTLTFDGSAETNGHLDLIGGAGNDVLKGGAGGDTFDLRSGGEDTITGGSGNDLIVAGAKLDVGDSIDGGAGTNNVARLAGDYSAGLTFGATTLHDIQTLQLDNDDYTFTAGAGSFGSNLTITATGLNDSHWLHFDGSAAHTSFHILGGSGNDMLTGGALADNFDISQGGTDTVNGGGGNDLITVGAMLTPSDSIDGGAGSDRVEINGDLTMMFTATTMVNVETLILDAGHTYALTTNDATVAAGQTLLVRGELLGATDSLSFNGNAETDGHFILRGGAGDDHLTGGQMSDTINITEGGNDVVKGGGGDDIIGAGGALTAADSISGGVGNDTLQLDGDYSAGVTFGATTVLHVETITLGQGHSYNLTTNDATVAAGATMTVDGSALGATDSLTLNTSAETDGFYDVIGGAGNDSITFGTNTGTVALGAGSDTLTFSAGLQSLNDTNDTGVDKVVYADAHGSVSISGDITSGAGTLTVDVSAVTGGGVTLDLSAATTTAIDVVGSAGDDTIDISTGFLGTIDGGAGNNTLVVSTEVAGSMEFDAPAVTGIDKIVYGAGIAADAVFTGDLTGDNGTLTIDASQGDGDGGAGPDDDMAFFDFTALTSTLDFTGTAVDDFVTVTSQTWSSLDGGGGNYNALYDVGANGLTFDAATVTGFNTLIFGIDDSDNAFDYSGISVAGDLTGNGGTLTINASQAGSVAIDVSQATSPIDFGGSAGDDTLSTSATQFGHDTIDGGGGNDTITLTGGAAVSDTSVTHEENLTFTGSASSGYSASVSGDITSGGGTLSVDAGAVTGGGVTLDLSAATTGTIDVVGSAGDDTVIFAAGNGNWGTVGGGAGNNTFELTDSSGAIVSGASVTHFSTLSFADGSSYNHITVEGDITSGGGTLAIDASALTGSNFVKVDASAATTTAVDFTGGAGDDTVTFSAFGGNMGTVDGGGGDNTLADAGGFEALNGATVTKIQNIVYTDSAAAAGVAVTGDITGGSGTLHIDATGVDASVTDNVDVSAATTAVIDFTGGAAVDNVIFGANFSASDVINGGSGNDTLEFDGGATGVTATLSAGNVDNFANVTVIDGGNYDLTFVGDITDDSATLTVAGNALTGSNVLTADFSQATTSVIDFQGGAGDDTVVFGTNLSHLQSLDGGAGNNTLGLNGNGSDINSNLSDSNIQNIANVTMADGGNYVISVSGDITGGGGTLTIDAGALSSSYGANISLNSATTPTIDFTGGAGDDTVSAWSSDVTVDFSEGGSDTFYGGPGNATIDMGGALDAGDQIFGYTGYTTVVLDGDYSAGITLSMLSAVNEVDLDAGHSYNITLDPSIMASGGLLLDGSALGTSDSLTVDTTPVTSGTINVDGGAGDDTVIFGANIANAGTVNGGAGVNTLALTGDGSDVTTSFDGSNFTNFSSLGLEDGNNYDITITSGFAGSSTLTIDASALSSSYGATVDASQITSGTVNFTGGAGDDTITVAASQMGTIDGGHNDALDQNALILTGGTMSTLMLQGYTGDDSVLRNVLNIETLRFTDGDSYVVTINGRLAGSYSDSLHVDASALTGSNSLTLDASASGAGASFIMGGAGNDTIFVANGGGEIDGNAGDDIIVINGFSGLVDGGDGNDTLELGVNSGIATLNSSTAARIESVVLTADQNYTLTIGDDISGGSLAIYASVLVSSTSALDLDLTNATTSSITVTGGAGDDIVAVGGNFANVAIDGGAGNNIVTLDGDYSAGITLSQIINIGEVDLTAGHSYNITLGISNASSGDFWLNGGALGAGDSLVANLTAVTSGEVDVTGGAGNDTITSGDPSGGTQVDLSTGGDDTFVGGAGVNYIYIGDALTTADSITGGSGGNYLVLEGDSYSSGFALDAGELHNIGYVKVLGDHTYVLTGDPHALSSNNFLIVDGGAMTGGSLQFDGSSVTDGAFSLYGGAGDDILKGGSKADTLDLSVGGEDQDFGNAGNDTFNVGGGLDAGDTVDGGAGTDTMNFGGDYSAGLVLGATTVTNVEKFSFANGFSYNITTNDATVASGQTLTVNASALTGSNALTFDGSAETDGVFSITGGAGNDVITGGAGADTFDFSKGGEDQINGNAGADILNAGAALDSGDTINGGAGTDTLNFNGDYSTGLVLGATTVTNVETFNFSDGHSYNITTDDATVAAGQTLTVTASALTGSNALVFNGAAETDGIFTITSGAGNDVLTGGAQGDSFTPGSGNDTINGGGGDDSVFYMTALTGADIFNGGAGNDYLGLGGKDYTGASAVVFTATSLSSVEEIQVNVGHKYSITMNDANVAAGATLLVDGTRSTQFTFDGSAETDGHLQIAGGAGADVLTGGQSSDEFIFGTVSWSTGTGYDTVTNVNFSSDHLWLNSDGSNFDTGFVPTGVDTAIASGALSTATFNTDLATAVNSVHLAANHAVLVTATSGTLSGHTFLVVDGNGTAGYQANADYVIDVTGFSGTLSTASFATTYTS